MTAIKSRLYILFYFVMFLSLLGLIAYRNVIPSALIALFAVSIGGLTSSYHSYRTNNGSIEKVEVFTFLYIGTGFLWLLSVFAAS